MATVYVALGANIGNREANLRMALRGIARMARVEAVSSLYESEPQGPPQPVLPARLLADRQVSGGNGVEGPVLSGVEGPSYYNAACRIETGLEPRPLLRFLKSLEEEIGRRPGGPRWGPRPIDLDILLYEERVVEEETLVIPHPRLAERAFVLLPLAEIAPDAQHPLLGKTAAELAKAVDAAGVKRIAGLGWDGVAGSDQPVRL